MALCKGSEEKKTKTKKDRGGRLFDKKHWKRKTMKQKQRKTVKIGALGLYRKQNQDTKQRQSENLQNCRKQVLCCKARREPRRNPNPKTKKSKPHNENKRQNE